MLADVVIAVLRYLGTRRNRSKLNASGLKCLLAIECTRLGDALSMLPALRSFRYHFPASELHVLVDERYAQFLENVGLDARVHGIRHPQSIRGGVQAVRTARSLNADLTLSMSPARKNALTALASGSAFRAGYLRPVKSLTPFRSETPVEALGFELERRVSYGRENIVDRSLKICDAFGIARSDGVFGAMLKDEVASAVSERLHIRDHLPQKDYVVVHPFSGWRYRTWSADGFAEIAERVVTVMRMDVVFTCAREEASQLEPIRLKMRGNTRVYFFPSSDILETAALLKNATLFVGNDSGPLHLASTLGIPIVGLFGPADPALTGPRSPAAYYIYKKVDCSPCDQQKCVRPHEPCMGLISPDEVFSAVSKMVGSR